MPELTALEISEMSDKEFYLPGLGAVPVNDDMRKEDVVALVKQQKVQAKVIHSADVGLLVLRKQLASVKKELLSAQIDKEIALEHAQDSERQRRGLAPRPPPLGKGKQREEEEEDQFGETPRPGDFPGGDDDPDDPSGGGGGGCHEPSFSFSLFLPFNQTFNLDFPISCGRQTKDVSLGERGHYRWTRVSTPPEPPTLVGPPLLIPTDARTRRWPLPPAQKA